MPPSGGSSPAHPFTNRLPVANGFWRSLLRRKNPQNAFIELNNALAAVPRVQDIGFDTIERINAEYGVDIHASCTESLEAAYRDYLKHCLRDRSMGKADADGVRHLRELFAISPAGHARVIDAVRESTYASALNQSIGDKSLTDDERSALDALVKHLSIPDGMKARVYAQEVKSLVQGTVNSSLSDAMLSPEEESEFKALAATLGVTLEYSETSQAALAQARLKWRIRFGELPTIDADVMLQRGEVCHFMVPAEWHEMRKVRVGVSYAGPSLRLRIAKGVYWNMGHFRGAPVTKDMLVKVDGGTLYLTSKRVVFTGPMRNMSLKLDKIFDITPYSDGVGIQRDTGKSPVFLFKSQIDIFCAMLARAISDYGK